jgi:hypothetical protein
MGGNLHVDDPSKNRERQFHPSRTTHETFCLAKRPSCARIAATGTKTGTIDDHGSVQIQARRDQIVDASLGPTIGGGTKNPRSTTGGVP